MTGREGRRGRQEHIGRRRDRSWSTLPRRRAPCGDAPPGARAAARHRRRRRRRTGRDGGRRRVRRAGAGGAGGRQPAARRAGGRCGGRDLQRPVLGRAGRRPPRVGWDLRLWAQAARAGLGRPRGLRLRRREDGQLRGHGADRRGVRSAVGSPAGRRGRGRDARGREPARDRLDGPPGAGPARRCARRARLRRLGRRGRRRPRPGRPGGPRGRRAARGPAVGGTAVLRLRGLRPHRDPGR